MTKLALTFMELITKLNGVADERLSKELAATVKSHAVIATASACIPIPGADIAATVANVWTMYYKINKKLGLSISEHAGKSIATAVVTNLGTAYAARFLLSSGLKFIPGIGSLAGAAILGATAYSVTIVSAIVYATILKEIVGKPNMSEEELKKHTENNLRDQEKLKKMLEEEAKNYEQEKKK